MIKNIFSSSLSRTFNNKRNFSIIAPERQTSKIKYKFQYAIGFKPHPNKIVHGGDDASFASDNILAVADGVGAWAKDDIEPSIYAHKLIKFIQKIYKNQKKATIQNPIYAVQQAVKLVKNVGATTLTIITLHPQTGNLKSYYIGDSLYGFFKKEQVEMTVAQMSGFNKPYQIGYLANNISEGYQNEYSYNEIKDDMIVIGSDGVWDNLTLERLHYEIRGPGSLYKNNMSKSLKQIAQFTVELGYKFSLSSNYQSPIYKRGVEQGIKYPKQGKVDDITILLARIVKQQLKKGQNFF